MEDSTVLSRHLLLPEMCFRQVNSDNSITSFDYNQICDMIDFWKVLLWEKYNARPGNKAVVEFNLTNVYYYSAVFACWELGITTIVDWVHAFDEKQAHSKYFRTHGKIDFALVYSEQFNPDSQFYYKYDCLRTELNCNHIITEKEFENYEILDPSIFDKVAQTIYAEPDTNAIWTATSGSTGDPKQQKVTHKETVLQATRLIKHLEIQETDRILHTNNLHHGASACYHFLPSLMQSENHYIMDIHYVGLGNKKAEGFGERLYDLVAREKINRLFLYSPNLLNYFLLNSKPYSHRVDITTLYYCPGKQIQLAQEKNINLIKSVFGDTTIGYGFLVKSVFPMSENLDAYEPSKISKKLDDFFDFKIDENNHLYISIPGLNKTDWKTSKDCFELKNNEYYFLGRGTDYRMGDEWVTLGEVERNLLECFGGYPDEHATVVIDNEEQEIYLVIWNENKDAEKKYLNWMKKRYKKARVNQIARHLDREDFMGARKISRPKLRDHFRSLTGRLPENFLPTWLIC